MSWLQKLKQGLSKSSQKVSDSLKSLSSVSSLIGASKLDASSLEEVEDALIGADLGTASAARLAMAMRKHKFDGPVTANGLALALADAIAEILQPSCRTASARPGAPAACFASGRGQWFGQNHNRRQIGATMAPTGKKSHAGRRRYVPCGGY